MGERDASVETQIRAAMERDACVRQLGIELLEAGPGFTRMRMQVRDDMLNVYAIGHGGMIFTLADSAFGYAGNTTGRECVAGSCSIEFLRPAQPGDVLTATATEDAVSGRNGYYGVRIENQQGETIALFHGRSRQIDGKAAGDRRRPA